MPYDTLNPLLYMAKFGIILIANHFCVNIMLNTCYTFYGIEHYALLSLQKQYKSGRILGNYFSNFRKTNLHTYLRLLEHVESFFQSGICTLLYCNAPRVPYCDVLFGSVKLSILN